MNEYLKNYQIFIKEKYTIFAETETKSAAKRFCLYCLKRKKSVYFSGN